MNQPTLPVNNDYCTLYNYLNYPRAMKLEHLITFKARSTVLEGGKS